MLTGRAVSGGTGQLKRTALGARSGAERASLAGRRPGDELAHDEGFAQRRGQEPLEPGHQVAQSRAPLCVRLGLRLSHTENCLHTMRVPGRAQSTSCTG